MQAFATFTGPAAVLDRNNVDTDQIIPKQFLKRIERSGFEDMLFYDWRYRDDGSENPDFPLNQDRYKQANILISGRNFGCGSSREHAVWALTNYGFRSIIAPTFADIFYNNCFQNGLLPITLPPQTVESLMRATEKNEGYALTIDLKHQKLITPKGSEIIFEIDAFRKKCLMEGLDDIALTLQHTEQISAYEQTRREYGDFSAAPGFV